MKKFKIFYQSGESEIISADSVTVKRNKKTTDLIVKSGMKTTTMRDVVLVFEIVPSILENVKTKQAEDEDED